MPARVTISAQVKATVEGAASKIETPPRSRGKAGSRYGKIVPADAVKSVAMKNADMANAAAARPRAAFQRSATSAATESTGISSSHGFAIGARIASVSAVAAR